MRILHTSDWHLGQHFMGKSREPEHRAFIHWLLETVSKHSVDALIIAGDIFDTGTPPSYARTLYNQFIVDLQKTPCRQLIIVGGNHDSVATLNESRELLACLGTSVIGGISDSPEDQVLILKDADGHPGAVVCAIPFIRPRDVLESRAGDSEGDKQQALQNAIAGHYKEVFEKASEHKLPVIATGHLTTVGGQLTESVREIYIGTLSAFPVSAFPPADYIALGHLHRSQLVSGHEHIRYSGSPIPLSFDETSHDKQVVLVDVSDNGVSAINPVVVPAFRSLNSLKGSLKQIQDQINLISENMLLEENDSLTPWLEIEVAEDDYLSDLQNRVNEMVAGKPLEVLRVRRKRAAGSTGITRTATETLSELSVNDVFRKKLESETISDDKAAALCKAFQDIVHSLEEEPQTEEKS